MNRWVISDTHFGHKNIIDYENRPFASVEDMNAAIINNWRKIVNKKDIVFMLGDFSFYDKELTQSLMSALPGRKILILGNHDSRSVEWYREVGFEHVSKWPIIIDDFYILSHAPVYLCSSMPYANIHGHIHSKKMTGGNYYNASVEHINYTPINLDAIKQTLSKNSDHRTIDQRVNDVKNVDAQSQLEHANKERIRLAARIVELEKIIQTQTS